jgi:hypothetical protein
MVEVVSDDLFSGSSGKENLAITLVSTSETHRYR